MTKLGNTITKYIQAHHPDSSVDGEALAQFIREDLGVVYHASHNIRLPWAFDGVITVADSSGVPVGWGSSTTSIREQGTDERGINFISYNTTESVAAIRAGVICAAVNGMLS